MATYSQNLTLTVPNGGTDEISIKVEELSYNANTNIATVRITLGFYVGIRWDDSNGGDVYADIYAVGLDSSGSGADLSCRWHIGRTNGVWDRYTWHYVTFDKTMYCTYDGKAQCTVQRWGWSRNTTNVYVPSDNEVYNGWAITTLNTHDRVSTLTLNTPSITIDGVSTLSMTVNRKSTLMTDHDLIITYPSAQGQYAETIQLRNSATTSSTHKANMGLLNYLPTNGKSITGQVILRTYYLPKWYEGTTKYVDSSPITFTATARDSDIAPTLTFNGIDWADDDNVTSGLVGNLDNYILNVSKCKITGTAQTKYKATPVSFGLFTNDNKSIGIVDTGTSPDYEFYLNQIAQNSNFSSSNTLKVQITDSRGLTGSINISLSFIPYIKKLFNETYNIARINPTSPTVKINSVTGKWWNGDFLGETPNDLTISWDYKEASSTGDYLTGGVIDTLRYSSGTPSGTYTDYDNTTQTFTISNYDFTKNGSSDLFDYQKAYLIRLTVTDAVTGQIANPLYVTISAGVANFTIHKDTILINGKTIWDILYPIGSVYMTEKSSSEFNPNNYFTGTTWQQINGYYLYAGTTPGSTSYTGTGAQSHILTAAESGVPAHSHTAATSSTSKTLSGTVYNILMDDYNPYMTGTDICSVSAGSGNNRSWSGTSGNAFRKLTINAVHSHNVSVNNNTATDASSGHPHNIATHTICVWRRTA